MHGMHTFLDDTNNIMDLLAWQKPKLFTGNASIEHRFDPNRDKFTNNFVNKITKRNRSEIVGLREDPGSILFSSHQQKTRSIGPFSNNL